MVGSINDRRALGELRAMQEAGRVANCAIMGQNASPEGREELRQPGTRLIGSVAYFPEKYGAEIVAVALGLLGPPARPPPRSWSPPSSPPATATPTTPTLRLCTPPPRS